MNSALTFTVYGIPQPQGSTRAFIPKGWKRPIITSANAKNKPWRQEVASCAITALNGGFEELRSGPVSLKAVFFFDKPKSCPKRCQHKTTRPDVDKLARSLNDALTGIVFCDDSQIVELRVAKMFGSPARAEIEVVSLISRGKC